MHITMLLKMVFSQKISNNTTEGARVYENSDLAFMNVQ